LFRYIITVSSALITGGVIILTEPAFSENPPQKGAVDTRSRLEREIVGKDGAPMVLIPAGNFTMGYDHFHFIEPFATILGGLFHYAPPEDQEPVLKVYLDEFYIDKYEVTTSRYAKFLRA